jgi:hypothetical protein
LFVAAPHSPDQVAKGQFVGQAWTLCYEEQFYIVTGLLLLVARRRFFIAALVNPNSPDWYRRYAWNDANGDKVWQPGEQTTLNSSSGGVGSTQLDPNLQDQRTREVATFLERELLPNFGVHAGFVWRRIDQLYQSDNLNRPISAFNVPVTLRDPGPAGNLGAAGPAIQAFNLNPVNLAMPVVNFLHNTPGKDDFYNLELSANKRMSNRWALNASYAYRWNQDNSVNYFGANLRVRQDVANPNDTINTEDGRYVFGLWTAKVNGTYDAPLGLRLTPAIRMQSGQPYARTFLATMNYGSQRILAEPFGTRLGRASMCSSRPRRSTWRRSSG